MEKPFHNSGSNPDCVLRLFSVGKLLSYSLLIQIEDTVSLSSWKSVAFLWKVVNDLLMFVNSWSIIVNDPNRIEDSS